MRSIIGVFIAFFPLFFFHGCGTKDAVKSTTWDEDLKQHVNRYWTHKINREFDKAYDYEYLRVLKAMTREKYVELNSSPMITYRSFRVEQIETKGEDVADVRLSIVPIAKAPGAKPFEYPIIVTERWVRVNSSWYRVGKGVADSLIHEKEEGGDVKN